MKTIHRFVLFAGIPFLMFMLTSCHTNDTVQIVIAAKASSSVQLAGQELSEYLGRLYTGHHFIVTRTLPKSGTVVYLGTADEIKDLCPQASINLPEGKEGYTVQPLNSKGRVTGACITGGTDRAVFYGVYGLLGKLGFGFYQSYESIPESRKGRIDFSKWILSDYPLVKDRIIFAWQNFLTGSSGWSRGEWQKWISQSMKQGINTIMVHVYGNDPIFTYEFNGITKPVGFWPNSSKGRGWANTIINDVRRLPSGCIISDGPVFGSEFSMAPDDQRVQVAQAGMQKVFSEAKEHDMMINFAIDVDTRSMLVPEMVNMVPESERAGQIPLPDSKIGYAFWKAQITGLLKLYPEISTITIWNRHSLFLSTESSKYPVAWQKEFDAKCEKLPRLKEFRNNKEKMSLAWEHFAISKVAEAYRKALNESGRENIRLAYGSWFHNNFDWMEAAILTLPEDVAVIALDWSELNGQSMLMHDDKLQYLGKFSDGRVLPFIWNQHDDGGYMGRPCVMIPDFNSRLQKVKAPGFGIIHWMIRPYDIFFRYHTRQVWNNTSNETLNESARNMAADWFGPRNSELLGDYLRLWSLDAPFLGRGTMETFFYYGWKEGVKDAPGLIQKCRERLNMLQRADTSSMNREQKSWLEYFSLFETFLINFCDTQDRIQKANALILSGQYRGAKEILSSVDATKVIGDYAAMVKIRPDDIGQRAMVLRLGCAWYGEVICLRQMAGLEPLRIAFGPSLPEPLATGVAGETYYNDFFDSEGKLWRLYGEKELPEFRTIATGGSQMNTEGLSSNLKELIQRGLILDKPLKNFPIRAINKGFEYSYNEGELQQGKYKLTLMLRRQVPGTKPCGLSILFMAKPGKDGRPVIPVKRNVSLPPETGEDIKPTVLEIPVTLTDAGQAQLDLSPDPGEPPVMSGLMMKFNDQN